MPIGYISCEAAHCRGGYYFCLDTKGSKKSSQQKCFFAAQTFPCKSGKTWAAIFLPFASPFLALASVKICYALQPHKAIIVLPDFARSCSTDGEIENQFFNHVIAIR
ncbi:hypothetical protein HDF18_21770 [Mucilaginibacter sp. X5P1]|uniref:hypothetical protein n=1 Tax=Mucilaginibacter sp. X5P1 TaxID=2723088 RepID=UPI0016206574|nr:hypothetical protein [Mucilaginibacter sp. X5P1]MBB6140244.1 hypothetical protein [Mucilaginibacter sp. X5P1]